jgi:DNA repair exonuclease SbcCD ATPase subunit
MSGENDIVERLRGWAYRMPAYSDKPDPGGVIAVIDEAAEEIERLRKERAQTDDQLAKARLKIEEQANRIDQLEEELSVLREALKTIKRP